MRKITLSGLALLLAAFFAMIQFGSPTAFAQSKTVAQAGQTQTGQQAHQQGQHPYQVGQNHLKPAEVFVGSISMKNGNYVLVSGATTYKLSNQAMAKKYNGKDVEVFGKLTPNTNTIHIKKIRNIGSGH